MTYHHSWSQTYLKGYQLTWEEHHYNNEWFNNMLTMLKPEGQIYVPLINKSFNKLGEEIDNSVAQDQHYFTLKEDIQ